jgi:ligand-binding sensor domain-containing protein
MKYRVLCWLFVLFSIHSAYPQNTIPDLTKSIEPPGTELLRNTLIMDIAEGPYGFIWIASGEGLFRYDGTELFKVFPEAFPHIAYSEATQTFAFTHIKGVHIYSVAKGKSHSYLSPNPEQRRMNTFCSFFAADTVLLIGQRDGFTRLNLNSNASQFFGLDGISNIPLSVYQIAGDKRDSNWLWIATSDGLFHYNLQENCQDHYYFEASHPEFTSSYNFSWDLIQHADGRISLGTEYNGVIQFDPSDGSYRQIYIEDRDTSTQRLPDDVMWALEEDADGNVWYSSKAGAMLYDIGSDSVLYHLGSPGSDPAYEVGPHLIDSKGRFWGGYGNGLKMIDPAWSRIKTITCPGTYTGQYHYEIWDVEQQGDTLYFCLRRSDGLYIYDLAKDRWEVIKPAKSDESITIDAVDILTTGDTLFLLESNRLYSYRPGDATLSMVPLEYDSIEYAFVSICRIAGNRYWIMTESKGLYVADLDAHTLHRHHTLNARFPDLSRSWGCKVYRDGLGYVWVITEDNILRGKPGVEDFVDLRDRFNIEKRLEIKGIFEEQGKLWLATYNGVYFVDPLHSDTILISKSYPGEACRLVRLNTDTLWIIDRVNVLNFNLKTGDSHVYSSGFGLPTSRFRGNRLLHDMGNGKLLVGGFKKFSIFRTSDLVSSATSSKPYLTSFESNGSAVDLDSSLYVTQRIALGPKENNLSIRFSSLGFQSSPARNYYFKLAGVDDAWQTTRPGEQSMRYSNLSGGKYTFALYTVDGQGNHSAISTTDIVIATPFLQMTGVQVTGGLLLLGMLYLVYRSKVRRIEERSRLQEQLWDMERKALRAQMNPHFVFNALNAIQYLITNGDELKAIMFLNKFSKLLRSVLDSSTESKILLEREIELLENYIELEALRMENKFTFQIRLDESLKNEKVKIPSLLVQPFVENAINHGLQHKDGVGHLRLEFLDKENYLICRVEDDGIGREASAALKAKYRKSHNSRGISISEARLKYYGREIHGKHSDHLVITDLKDQNNCAVGTRVEITVPLEVI